MWYLWIRRERIFDVIDREPEEDNGYVKLSPKKVIYISCNPETLARDLKYLTKHHYKVEKIQPVDMFPFCNHCETVCELVRK